MEGGAYAYLVCVDGKANSNKFYEMKQVSPGEFIASWGREDSSRAPQSMTYPMHRWDEVYRKRVNKRRRKSYTDITDLVAEEVVVDDEKEVAGISSIKESRIRKLLSDLRAFATGSVQRNYTVTSDSVTLAQVDRAREILAEISAMAFDPNSVATNRDINRKLEDLYTVIPRRMAKVADHMLPYVGGLDTRMAQDLFHLETDNVDVMAGQVRAQARDEVADIVGDGRQSILDAMGVTMRLATDEEVAFARSMVFDSAANARSVRIGTVFAVENQVTQAKFDEHLASIADRGLSEIHLATDMYWHGSRNENWLSILDTGLLVRPPRVTTTGDMFGLGIYFSDKFSKAFNYTSYHGSYFAHGSSSKGFMAIFNVHIGKQYEVDRHSSSHYGLSASKLQSMGYDSTWGKSGPSLLNSEYVIYRPRQCTVAFLVELV